MCINTQSPMKYEHIDIDELLLTEESLRKIDVEDEPKNNGAYQNSIMNLTRYKFEDVNYSLFPIADSDGEDSNKYISEGNPINHSLQSTRNKTLN